MSTPPYYNDHGLTLVECSDDPTGITNMNRILGAAGVAREIRLNPGQWIIPAEIPLAWNQNLRGSGRSTLIIPTFNGDCIRQYNSTTPSGNYSTQENQQGTISDLMIDGYQTTGNSSGLHVGDMLGARIKDVYVRNFNSGGAGTSKAIWVDNANTWTEKYSIRAQAANSDTLYYFSNDGGTGSLEYSLFDLVGYWTNGQNCIVVNNISGASEIFTGGTDWFVRGNCNGSSPGPFLTMEGTVFFHRCWLAFCPENNSSGTPATINDAGGGTNQFSNCYGWMDFGGNAWGATNVPNGHFSFSGPVQVVGDTTLQAARSGISKPTVTTPSIAPSTAFTNDNGVDVSVIVSGGTGVAVTINGHATGQSAGQFYVPMGGTINLGAYSVAPTVWVWIPAAYP
jgi:hypothetical protein